MKEFKGTPGPWEANERVGISAAITHRNPAAIGVPGPTLAKVIIRYSALEQGQANLKVIAAAPELLEALRQLRDYVQDMYGDSYDDCLPEHPMQLATSAINKALGE